MSHAYNRDLFQAGEGKLDLAFKGMLADDMQGIYRSTYKDASGKESNIMSTQFEVRCVRSTTSMTLGDL